MYKDQSELNSIQILVRSRLEDFFFYFLFFLVLLIFFLPFAFYILLGETIMLHMSNNKGNARISKFHKNFAITDPIFSKFVKFKLIFNIWVIQVLRNFFENNLSY